VFTDPYARLGLHEHSHKSEAEVEEFVETVASGPTVALGFSLRNIDRAGDRTLAEVIDAEAEAQVFASETDDHTEGVTAFQEDRDPAFEGR